MIRLNTEKRKKLLAIALLAALVAVIVVIYIRVGEPMTALVKDSERFRAWV